MNISAGSNVWPKKPTQKIGTLTIQATAGRLRKVCHLGQPELYSSLWIAKLPGLTEDRCFITATVQGQIEQGSYFLPT